jgi:hypothetical protein
MLRCSTSYQLSLWPIGSYCPEKWTLADTTKLKKETEHLAHQYPFLQIELADGAFSSHICHDYEGAHLTYSIRTSVEQPHFV